MDEKVVSPDSLPPHDKEVERAVLGVVLTEGSILPEAAHLQASDFHVRFHALAWAAMLQLSRDGIPIDPISLRMAIQRTGASIPGETLSGDIADLLNGIPVRKHLAFYVDNVRKYSLLRKAAEGAEQVIRLANSKPDDLRELTRLAESVALALKDHGSVPGVWGFPLRTWDLSPAAMTAAEAVAWTIEPLMAAPDVVSLVGDGGVGKSKLAAAIALAVAFGKPVLGHFAVPHPGRVVYLNEERPDLTLRHLHTLAAGLEIDSALLQERINLLGRGPRTWRVTDAVARNVLVQYLRQLGGVALVVFDSLHVLHDLEENDNAEMTRVIEAFRRISLEVNCCGLIIHHTGKGLGGESSLAARGASAIKDSVDSQFVVRRAKSSDPSILRMHQEKTRRALVDPFEIRMEHDQSGEVLGISLIGPAPSKADEVLQDVLNVIDNTKAPLKSAEIAGQLSGKHRKDDVYIALAQIRAKNLRPWREGPRKKSYIYGRGVDGSVE